MVTDKFKDGIDKWAEENEMPEELRPDFKALVVKTVETTKKLEETTSESE
jgi:hypothetical protein